VRPQELPCGATEACIKRVPAVIPLLATLGALIVVTHASRHLSGWLGERWGGLLVALPISTTLTLLYCLWEHGAHYAAKAAQAGMLGLCATVAFAVVTAQCLSRFQRLALAVAVGAAAYGVAALAVAECVVAALLLGCAEAWLTSFSLLLSLGLIAIGHHSVRDLGGRPGRRVAQRQLAPGWKRLLRTAIPVACLACILLFARNAEADWAGLFGTFPCTMLAVLVVTGLEAGPDAAVELLRTYPIGKCSTLAFLAVFALLTPALGPAAGYTVGYLAAGCVLTSLVRRSATFAEPALG
jgi:hypothetical protein